MKQGQLLIADDDDMICKYIKTVAEGLGFTAAIANNFYQFQHLYHSIHPTLIILDLNLTENDGIELLRFLAKQKCHCPILIISGCDEKIRTSSMRLGQSYGLEIYKQISKPIEISNLKELLLESQNYSMVTAERLSKAISDFELTLHFQPQMQVDTQKIAGLEALVRWQPKANPLIFPDAFIPLAEQTGLIEPLTFWVLENAIKQQKLWENQAFNFNVAINLSCKLLNDISLPDKIEKIAKHYQANPKNICLEVTEAAIFKEPQIAMDIITRLGIKGFKISIDNFGTGFSSLVQLYKMPFREIKIDKSFVIHALNDPEAWIIIKSIVDLAHNLKLLVVAEGVENGEILERLKKNGCDIVQGSYISRPISESKLPAWIEHNLDNTKRIQLHRDP